MINITECTLSVRGRLELKPLQHLSLKWEVLENKKKDATVAAYIFPEAWEEVDPAVLVHDLMLLAKHKTVGNLEIEDIFGERTQYTLTAGKVEERWQRVHYLEEPDTTHFPEEE